MHKQPIRARMRLDLETVGLRTDSYTQGVKYKGRGPYARLGITELAFQILRGNRKGRIKNYYNTDAIGPELLAKHGIDSRYLSNPALSLPQSFYDDITSVSRDAAYRYDPSAAVEGSVVNTTVRNHINRLLSDSLPGHTGPWENKPGRSGVAKKMASVFESIKSAPSGSRLTLESWNIGFDIPEVLKELRHAGYGDLIDSLVSSNRLRARDLGEGMQKAFYDLMVKDKSWTPKIGSRAIFQTASQQRIQNLSAAQIDKLGGVVENRPLRLLMDDILSGNVGSRTRQWLINKGIGASQADAVSKTAQKHFARAGEGFHRFKKSVAGVQAGMENKVVGGMSIFDIINNTYADPRQAHIKVMGDADHIAGFYISGKNIAPGAVNPFGYIAGSRVEDVANYLKENADTFNVPAPTMEVLKEIESSAHAGAVDVKVAGEQADFIKHLSGEVEYGAFLEGLRDHNNQAVYKNLQRGYQDVVGSGLPFAQKNAAQPIKNKVAGLGDNILERMGASSILFATAAIFAAGYWTGTHNKSELPREPKLDGLRKPVGQWDLIDAITGHDLPFSNVSAFGSGYSQYKGFQPQGEQVRVSRVIDGDTVVFYRGGQKVTARLAGIDTFEKDDPSPYHRYKAGRASKFLRNLVEGQQVFIRPQWGDERDQFGRELVFMDVNGTSVNKAVSDAGYSPLATRIPEPINGRGPWSVLKRRMQQGMEVLAEILEPFVGSSEENRDVELWNMLGTGGQIMYPEVDIPLAGGYGGYVQRKFALASGRSRIRDHASQLMGLPGMPSTPMISQSYNSHSHAMAYTG